MKKLLFLFLCIPFTHYTQESNGLEVRHHEKIFKCAQCSYVAINRLDLKKHGRLRICERPFSCDKCPRTFNSKSNLVRHQRVHMSVKPYQCLNCFRCFAKLSHYQDHMQKEERGEYICVICNRTFMQKRYLISHEATNIHQQRVMASQQAPKDAIVYDEIDWQKVEDIIKSVPTGFFSLPE